MRDATYITLTIRNAFPHDMYAQRLAGSVIADMLALSLQSQIPELSDDTIPGLVSDGIAVMREWEERR